MDQDVVQLRNAVGGEAVDAVDGGLMDVVNPATAQVLARVPEGTQADVDRAVEAAVKALPGWLDTTPAERAEALLRLAGAIEDHVGEFVELESLNVGKPPAVGEPEIPFVVDNLRFLAGAARVPDGTASGEYLRGYTSMLRREPVGVVGLIAPWNYPLMMAAWKLGPALAAGNVCVLKPAEQTPLTTLRLAELAQEIFPPGVLNVITGNGDPVGTGIVRHPDIGMVSLTGDVATGKEVARAAADTLKRVHLELGGKAPVLVFPDADLAEVAAAVKLAGFWNAGQECAAACRVVAADAVYDGLLAELAPAVESIRVGDPARDRDLDMGPVISAEQQDRVTGFVERARSAGGEVITGNAPQDGNGFFVRPTLVTGVGQADEIVQRARQAAETHEKEAKDHGQGFLTEASKRAEREIEAATQRALDDIRKEVADLTIMATEKVTRKTLDEEDQRKLVEQALSELDFSNLSSGASQN